MFWFKELIQNAEDAGATEVRFLYDETQYGTESLWSKEMAQYQGKCIFSYIILFKAYLFSCDLGHNPGSVG